MHNLEHLTSDSSLSVADIAFVFFFVFVFILSAISAYTTGLKALYDPFNCTSTVQLLSY